MHAATFGGNPVAAAAGIAAVEMIERDNLLEKAGRLGELFRQRLTQLQGECGIIREVRVAGLMIGVELAVEGARAVEECLRRRLLINCTHKTVIRLLPAMTLEESQVHEGCDILAEVLKAQAA
jgi:acetylornithine/succinyldiaminopimelate/putrescine aminotransferase